MITIELPWPDKRLSPNARNKWAKIKAIEEAREYGGWVAHEARMQPGIVLSAANGLKAQYAFYPPDRRRRDQDNYSAMMKSYQDGVCDALGIDDSCFQMAAPVWAEVVKGGKVVLRLEEMK